MILFFSIAGILAILVLFILLYYNRAFPEAREIADEMTLVGKDYSFYGESGIGFLIFSGAKTDERAYAFLAKLLHEEGHTVVIPKQRFHLSAFGTKHGLEIIDSHPEVRKWIPIGHSLGGMPVSRIAAARTDDLMGVVFLATYASIDLSGLDLAVLRITAEHDGVMNNDRMENYHHNLPKNTSEKMLKGANHQGFAAYRSMSGRDGKVSISWQEQNKQTAQLILDFFFPGHTEERTATGSVRT